MTLTHTRRFAAALALLLVGCDRREPDASLAAPSATAASSATAAPSSAAAPSSSAAPLGSAIPMPHPGPSAVPSDPAKPPNGFVRVRVGGVMPAGQGNAVLLVDDKKQRALVVFIGETEALSIQLRLQGTRYKRPLTHDLIDTMLDNLGARVQSVRVDRLEDDIFYGVVVLRAGNRIHEFDSRTSDGIALALGSDAPLFVAGDVLDRAGIPLDADGTPRFESEPEPSERPAIAL
ncbi:MAG TPA: bifunctional nuclease family protein [Polyangiaceae bacterium]|nr:bifunctional nuclease family protein [Polyangiaceae bacterium]